VIIGERRDFQIADVLTPVDTAARASAPKTRMGPSGSTGRTGFLMFAAEQTRPLDYGLQWGCRARHEAKMLSGHP